MTWWHEIAPFINFKNTEPASFIVLYMQDSYLHAWKTSRKKTKLYRKPHSFPQKLPPSAESNKDERKHRKGKGKRRNRNRGKSTTPFNPEHTVVTNGHTSPLSTTEDPCLTTHLGYCIHGYCKHIEGLKEPVCMWVQQQVTARVLCNTGFSTLFVYAPIWAPVSSVNFQYPDVWRATTANAVASKLWRRKPHPVRATLSCCRWC